MEDSGRQDGGLKDPHPHSVDNVVKKNLQTGKHN